MMLPLFGGRSERYMDMREIVLLILLCLPGTVLAEDCPMNGYWTSNEEMTLSSFNEVKNATQKQKEIFSKDFFGKLYIHTECNKFTVIMDDWKEVSEYKLISVDGNSVKISYLEFPGDTEPTVKEAIFEGECYSVPINGGQFREYFCPITEQTYNKRLLYMSQNTRQYKVER